MSMKTDLSEVPPKWRRSRVTLCFSEYESDPSRRGHSGISKVTRVSRSMMASKSARFGLLINPKTPEGTSSIQTFRKIF